MSYNGSGTFNINTAGQPVVTGTVISSTAFNALTADLATGLSTAITKDGQTAATARIPFAQGISSTLVTDSTSTTTGSIITAGGAGVAKALFVGTTANVAGAVTLQSTLAVAGNAIISVTDNTNAALRITQLGTGNALVVEDSTNPDSSAFIVNSDGRTVINGSSAVSTGVGNAYLQINGGTTPLSMIRQADATTPINIEFAKARAAGAILNSGDTIGRLYFSGSDGTAQIPAAYIDAAVDGTPGTSDMPGRLVFSTTADGASSPTERMRIDSSGDVGVGTTAPRAKLSVTNGTENTSGDAPQEAIITGANQAITAGLGILTVQSNTAIAADVGATVALGGRIRNTGTTTDASNFVVLKGAKENATSDNSAGYFAVATKPNANAPVERMRIDSSGTWMLNTTDVDAFIGSSTSQTGFSYRPGLAPRLSLVNDFYINRSNGDGNIFEFRRNGSAVGTITVSAGATAYNTSSDYRLKEAIVPMTGALAKVALLKPCTYKWKADGSDGQGFIAHELAEVVPGCVTGEKDAVDADNNPVYQGIDTSFLVATLTAAIQELKAIVDTQAARITALEAA